MSQSFIIKIDSIKAGLRIDKAVSLEVSDISRSKIVQLIEEDCLSRDGKIVNIAKTKTKEGEEYLLTIPEPKAATPEAQDIPLDVLYEDSDIIVINKQAGLVVHPGAGNYDGTLVNALLYHCKGSLSGIGGVERPGIVHRLDADTSGVMVIAKSNQAHMHLASQFANRENVRSYFAFIWGVAVPSVGQVEGNIGRHPKNRLKMTVLKDDRGRYALTYYKTITSYGDMAAAKVECRLATGRTHQIRVHMCDKGHPIIGDKLYGFRNPQKHGLEEESWQKAKNFPRQALHAATLGFIHPISNEEMFFKSPLPTDMLDLQQALELSRY
ncbi:MAG: RluA family pseudouridine synthase [Alphaproteobacteria bacterium]